MQDFNTCLDFSADTAAADPPIIRYLQLPTKIEGSWWAVVSSCSNLCGQRCEQIIKIRLYVDFALASAIMVCAPGTLGRNSHLDGMHDAEVQKHEASQHNPIHL
jgi:hypothetical protein